MSKRITYVDGVPVVLGERGDITAFVLWNGGKVALVIAAAWLVSKVAEWIAPCLGL